MRYKHNRWDKYIWYDTLYIGVQEGRHMWRKSKLYKQHRTVLRLMRKYHSSLCFEHNLPDYQFRTHKTRKTIFNI